MGELLPARVKHFCNIGDVVASLAGLKSYHEKTGKKVIFCQQLNVPADYYAGATHPVRDDNNTMVMCNQKMFDMVRPLLLSQSYIQDMEVFRGQPINFDLDRIRKEIFVNIPNQAIQQWLFMAYPDLAYDLSKSWIDIGDVDISDCSLSHPNVVTETISIEDLENKIIVNFTERYRNQHLHYFFLKEYQEMLIFAGTESEHKQFCDKWGLTMPRLIVTDFLQLAYIIKKSKFLFGNQSFCWNVAEAMKTPRLLEVCEYAPNCQPFIGEHSYGYLHQSAIKYYFKLLLDIK